MRGDVHRLKAPRDARGHEQKGHRFAIVIQSDDLYSSSLIVAPTSQSARPMDHRPRVTIAGEWTHVLVEQMASVDPSRLGDLVGRLSLAEMQDIDAAIRSVLDL